MTLSEEAQQFISPYTYRELRGRVLRVPAKKNTAKRNILFIYGSHSSIERNYGLAEAFAEYGSVTNPDLPGFGGMDSLQSIGKQPNFANMADYLADFIEREYKGEKITIAGFSMGFSFATEMLARYPDISKQVDLVINIAGSTNRNDFSFNRVRHRFFITATWLLSFRMPATIYRYVFLNGWWLRKNYAKSNLAKSKFKGLSVERKNELLEMEVHLWHINDVQTWAHTLYCLLTADQSMHHIDRDVHYIKMSVDQYFNTGNVVENLDQIYKKVHVSEAKVANHSPTVIATAKEASRMIPDEIKEALRV